MTTTFIYTLTDPVTGLVRYLGKADNPFTRLQRHLRESRSFHRVCWIKGLKARGLLPRMDLLDEVPRAQWQFWEREYIRLFRMIGVPLTNGTEGGDGGVPTPEVRAKIKAKAMGRVISEKARRLISLHHTGTKLPPLHRANISEGLRYRKEQTLLPLLRQVTRCSTSKSNAA